MKKFLAISALLLFGVFLCTGNGFATTIKDPNNGESNLHMIWKNLFGDSGGSFSSSQALFSSLGLNDSGDDVWKSTNGSVTARATYAGYTQNLGFSQNGITEWIFQDYGNDGIDDPVNFGFQPNGEFVWVEGWDSGSGSGEWFSQDTMNGDGELDHFVAIKVPQASIDYYNSKYNSNIIASLEGEVWFLAFEDFWSLGDQDYNDLVFLVQNVAPVPEPATMFLFGIGLIVLAGVAKRRIKKAQG
jgi:hypothetical protein